MAELDEIEVINAGGVPLYFHSNSGRTQDETYLLQASFITALSQFAKELNNGEVRLISMEKKDYLLTKNERFTVLFTSYHQDNNDFQVQYESQIMELKDFLESEFSEKNIDLTDPNSISVDLVMDTLHDYLLEKELVEDGKHSSKGFREEVNGLIFKSVGYEPGKCNIGRTERMRRLNFGLFFFIISFLAFTVVLLLQLPEWLVFLLIVPNFLGFLGLLQYFYRFCTTNALSQQYQMV